MTTQLTDTQIVDIIEERLRLDSFIKTEYNDWLDRKILNGSDNYHEEIIDQAADHLLDLIQNDVIDDVRGNPEEMTDIDVDDLVQSYFTTFNLVGDLIEFFEDTYPKEEVEKNIKETIEIQVAKILSKDFSKEIKEKLSKLDVYDDQLGQYLDDPKYFIVEIMPELKEFVI